MESKPYSTQTYSDIGISQWLFDEQLTVAGAGTPLPVQRLVAAQRDTILHDLHESGQALFGNGQKYQAFSVRKGIIVQLLSAQGNPEADRMHDLRLHSSKLNAIFESTALYIFTVDKQQILTSYNSRFKRQMQSWFSREMTIGRAVIDEPTDINSAQWKKFKRELGLSLTGKKRRIDLSFTLADESQVSVEIFMDPIKSPDCDDICEVSCIAYETTDQKKMSERIKRSLEEKETLLKEVHHRVKNNLQIISSILSLQGNVVKDQHLIDVLQESRNRIQSMSFIHESLYTDAEFSSVDIRHYVHGLCRNLQYTYTLEGREIELQIEVEEIHLILDQAIPCGLIINELISNAFKHAYGPGEKGEIRIDIAEKEGLMHVCVSDDGKGIPAEWDIEESDSLGLQLVYTLTEQIDGEITLTSGEGTEYLITFERK